jgi:hypothetical protein
MALPPSVQPDSPYLGQALKPDGIRLLTIIWTTSDQFELRTECHPLTADLQFDAISYVWGSAPASVRVKCNDGTLLVTPTAFEMLGYLYLYKPDPQRPIWVDAICINQNDAEEKAVQVPLMHRIYSSAKTVLVWPGRLDQIALDCARDLQEIPRPWDCKSADDAIRQRWPLDWFSEWSLFWQGLSQLITLDWFERLWTFQEVVLAKEAVLFCGQIWVDLDHLLQFVLRMYRDPTHPFGKGRSVDHRILSEFFHILQFRRLGRIGAAALPSLLHVLRRRRSIEEIDRIWAIFGLLDKTMQSRLSPLIDYTEAARRESWRTVIGCMKHVVTASQNLYVLHLPRANHPKDQNLPSWCPDLRGRGEVTACLNQFWKRDRDRSPAQVVQSVENENLIIKRREMISSNAKKLITVSDADDYLYIRGFEVDTIVETVEDERLVGAWNYTTDYYSSHENYMEENPTHITAMEWLSSGCELARRVLRYCADREAVPSLPDEFYMTFWLSESVSKVGKSICTDAIRILMTYDYSMKRFEGEKTRSRLFQAHRALDQFRELVGHTWISTEDGRFGLATPRVKPGDRICVFHGAEPLYIIRPHSDCKNSPTKDGVKLWDFVGLAYIPHLMDQQTTDDARKCPDQMYVLA